MRIRSSGKTEDSDTNDEYEEKRNKIENKQADKDKDKKADDEKKKMKGVEEKEKKIKGWEKWAILEQK